MKFYLLILFSLITVKIFATAQIPDKLIFEKKEYKLHSNPLEEYFEKYPEKRPSQESFSTALWRGYVATFEIINNELFVKDIEVMVFVKKADGSSEIEWKSVLSEIFKDNESKKVDWLSGILVVPFGKLKNYVHMGYGSSYSKYLLFSTEKGNITGYKQLKINEYEKFKDLQFQAFKKTEEYKKIKIELMNESKDNNEAFIDDFLRNYIVNYTSKFLE